MLRLKYLYKFKKSVDIGMEHLLHKYNITNIFYIIIQIIQKADYHGTKYNRRTSSVILVLSINLHFSST